MSNDNPWTSRLSILVLTHVVGTVNIVSVLAMSPVLIRQLDLSAAQFGFFITAYYGAQAVCSMPAGGLVDRIGVGRSLVVSHAIMVLGALAMAMANSFAFGLAALALMGAGYSISNPATARGVFEWFPQKRRATAMGIKQVGVPLGGILGATNGALVTIVPISTIMLGIAVLVLINGVLCLRLARLPITTPDQEKRHPLANIREVMGDWNINRFVIINGLYNFGQTNFFAFLTLFMREVALASQPMASMAVGIAQASSAVGRIGWAVVSDTLFKGRRKGLVVGLGVAAVVFLAAMVIVGTGPGIYLGLGLALVLGLTIASFAPLVQTLSVETTEPRLAGSAMGYSMFATHIGGMIGPPVFGAIVDATGTYASGWLLTAAVVGVGTMMLAFGFKERRNHD
ncbi:MAG: MFS transporter [Proteobacteria bacterium]|nr:MFS transporter [Pseudomonadota bacterium]MDA1024044.1 MFS transporter [Pseudomonadota bacterium]